VRRFWIAGVLLLGQALSGCSAGMHSNGFVEPHLMAAYVPLVQREDFLRSRWGAGLNVAPHVAVTNDHNLNLIPKERLLARSRDYDLLFFRSDDDIAPPTAKARAGEPVIAYGQGMSEDLREARGTVSALDEHVPARCEGCAEQRALVFDANAGGGFSGGPVVDAETGAVLGITFGYIDRQSGRRMYAYDIDLVLAEMRRLLGR